jgi:hypothetical protein
MTQNTDDKQQATSILDEQAKLESGFGYPDTLLTDDVYFSQGNNRLRCR